MPGQLGRVLATAAEVAASFSVAVPPSLFPLVPCGGSAAQTWRGPVRRECDVSELGQEAGVALVLGEGQCN